MTWAVTSHNSEQRRLYNSLSVKRQRSKRVYHLAFSALRCIVRGCLKKSALRCAARCRACAALYGALLLGKKFALRCAVRQRAAAH